MTEETPQATQTPESTPTTASIAAHRPPESADQTLRPAPKRPPLRITCDCGHD